MNTWGKILLALIIAVSISAIFYFFWEATQDTSEVSYASVLIATEEIAPRTLITEQMFTEKKIGTLTLPAGSFPANVYTKKEDVIGKYTVTYYTVPKNSYLFESYILPGEEIKDGMALLLKEGERMIAIDVNLRSSLAGQIVEGSYINLWLKAEEEVGDEKHRIKQQVVGPFMNYVRVIGTYSTGTTTATPTSSDQSANQVNKDKDIVLGKNIVPQTILLAVSDKQTALITLAEKLGEITVVGTNYSEDSSSTDIPTKYAEEWLLSKLGYDFLSQETAEMLEQVFSDNIEGVEIEITTVESEERQ